MSAMDKLREDFPLLYRGPDCMPDDGWEPLLRRLSVRLEAHVRQKGRGYYVVQCKEKFGSLRVYMSKSSDKIEALIAEAEAESRRTCEVCGGPGKLTGKHWVKTACEEHAK